MKIKKTNLIHIILSLSYLYCLPAFSQTTIDAQKVIDDLDPSQNTSEEVIQQELETITDNPTSTTENAEEEIKEEKDDKSGLTKIFDKIINNSTSRKSIMYSEEENQNIRDALKAFKSGVPLEEEIIEEVEDEEEKVEENRRSHIYLSSILYQSKNNWTVWINDEKISNKNNNPKNELYIASINKNSVQITWTMSVSKWQILTNSDSDVGAPINENNQVEIKFTLSFNQTYVLNGNKIVEGRAGLSFIEKTKDKAQSIINSIEDSVDSISIPNF